MVIVLTHGDVNSSVVKNESAVDTSQFRVRHDYSYFSFGFKDGGQCKSPNEALADEQTLHHQQQQGRERTRAKLSPIAHAQNVIKWAWLVALSMAQKDSVPVGMDLSSTLPDELILKIFRYLVHSELINCLRVCQRWHRLANDDSLWHEVEITWYKLLNNASLLSTIAQKHPSVHTLVVMSKSSLRDSKLSSLEISAFSSIWTPFKNLSKLAIYNSPASFFHVLPNMLSTYHETLTCFSCEGSDGLESEQFQFLFTNASVRYRELSIAHCSMIGDLAIFQAQLNSHFSECLENLELLNLDGVGTVGRLSDAGMIVLLSACPLLKSLSCDGETMTDESSKHIQKLSKLEHLSISFCTELTDKSLECFSKLKNLTSLHLKKGYEFTNQGFENLFDNLCLNGSPYHSTHRKVGRLRKLYLIECKLLRDSGLVKLAQNFPNLIHLDLSWCWNLSDIGLEAVAQHCCRIETLKLVGLKNAMCVPVLSASLPRLRYLDLEQVDLVDDEELKRLKEAKPWIKITDYYDEEVVSNDPDEL